MAARGFLGAGDLYISRYNPTTGLFDDFTGPFEATKFEVKPNVELKEMSSRGRSSYGQVIESVALPQPADFTLELPEVNKESLSIALLGTESAINQTAGTLTAASVTVTSKDAWLDIGKQNITAGLVVKDATGVTTYVMGTDYEKLMQLRMAVRTQMRKSDPLYRCSLCGVAVHICRAKDKPKFFFRHQHEDGSCPAQTKGELIETKPVSA